MNWISSKASQAPNYVNLLEINYTVTTRLTSDFLFLLLSRIQEDFINKDYLYFTITIVGRSSISNNLVAYAYFSNPIYYDNFRCYSWVDSTLEDIKQSDLADLIDVPINNLCVRLNGQVGY